MVWYELGNSLRGYFGGEFEDDENAWNTLSERFNNAYPSRSGRTVYMTKVVRDGKTAGGNETEQDRKLREKLELMLAEDVGNG